MIQSGQPRPTSGMRPRALELTQDRTILIALDTSDFAVAALKFAATHVIRDNDAVVLLRVVSEQDAVDTYYADFVSSEDELRAELNAAVLFLGASQAELLVETYSKSIANWSDCHAVQVFAEVKIASTSVGETICSYADELKPSMIVMGSRGLGVVHRMLLGSTSSYVSHHAGVPVLIVREETTREVVKPEESKSTHPKPAPMIPALKTELL
ncbi:hypothetical protein SmJEL517_g02702 [Synchytrium microbalum]|uniref:UspA domain-containing protein n=1 Tax=Synchytrium microbalum TaxID=1806994 RepID=A0A507C5M1_9FUNG|nr:uncharacterized protein SmJEL517_g02702 [Synchytrium microbalum]TPX34668.1 hypothetical protein SmJEL517_g02702 [Synchytrium microbalum]